LASSTENSDDATARTPVTEQQPLELHDEILRATRWWVLWGSGGFAVLCILIGAVEALFGR